MLGARQAAAFDIAAACSGFIYALSIAEQYIKAGTYRTILVIGAEVLSKVIDWADRSTCVIFSDGAGAAVIQASSEPGQAVLSTHLFADGQYAKYLYIPGGGSLHPATHETIEKRMHYVKMSGNELFKVAVRSMEKACMMALEHNGLKPSDVNLLIPHQANLRIIETTANRLGLPMEKVVVTIHRYGNASSATIPIALDETLQAGRIRKGDIVLSVAFGGGVTWASAVIRW
jgi:3-oxoacyl-[acyl-carrier-protein] synthase-3